MVTRAGRILEEVNDLPEYDDPPKICKDCGAKIEFLADFPGPRCLNCHAKKVSKEPLERPDFTKGIRKF